MDKPIRADKIKGKRVSWLWEDRVPRGMITIFAGPPDAGKGLATIHIAAAVTRMKIRNKDGSTRPGRVLYSAAEDSYEVMTIPRLQAAGAVMQNVDMTSFMLPADWDEFAATVKAGIDLVVIDPIAAHLSGGVNRHTDSIRKITNPLKQLINETGTAVIVVEHVLKKVTRNTRPLGAIGGSGSGLVAAARMVFLFGAPPLDEDSRVLAAVKANISKLPKALEFELDTRELELESKPESIPFLLPMGELEHFDPLSLVMVEKGRGPGRPPAKREAAAEWLTTYLYQAGKPILVGDITEDAKQFQPPMSAQTLKRAAKEDVHVVVTPPGGGRYTRWSLPDELVAELDKAKGLDVSKVTDDGMEGEALISDDDLSQLLSMGLPSEGEEDADEG